MFWSNIYNYIKLVTLYYILLQSSDFVVTFEKISFSDIQVFGKLFGKSLDIFLIYDINRVTVELIFFFSLKLLNEILIDE